MDAYQYLSQVIVGNVTELVAMDFGYDQLERIVSVNSGESSEYQRDRLTA